MHKLILLSLFFVSIIFFSVFLSRPGLAQEEATPSVKLERGGSYELFWPLTAGKTMDDSFYFLKLWREGIGKMFIFDTTRKADYEVTLSTKRVLEAEKLLKEGKEDKAMKTLENALSQLTLARGKFSKATKRGNDFQVARSNLLNQLANLNIFMQKLTNESTGNLQNTSSQVKDVTEKFLNDVKNP